MANPFTGMKTPTKSKLASRAKTGEKKSKSSNGGSKRKGY